MNEIEQRLLETIRRLETQYQLRDQNLAERLIALTKQLSDGSARLETLSGQVAALNKQLTAMQSHTGKR